MRRPRGRRRRAPASRGRSELSSLPVQSPLERGGRAYGSCGSAPNRPIEPRRRDRGSRDRPRLRSCRLRRSGSGTRPSDRSYTRVGRSARCRVPRGVDRTAHQASCCGDPRRLCRCSRPRRRAAAQHRAGARRDLLLPVVLDAGEGRAVGALVRRTTTGRPCCRRRTTRPAASTRRRTRRSSPPRCARSPKPAWDPSSSPGGVRLAGDDLRLPSSSRRRRSRVLRSPSTSSRTAAGRRRRAAEDIDELHREAGSPTSTSTTPTATRPPTGRGARAARRRAHLRAHAARRAGQGSRLRRPLHLRRRDLERRALPAALHAGARAGLLCAPSVGPGYDARLATRHEFVRPRNDGRPTTACGRRADGEAPTS